MTPGPGLRKVHVDPGAFCVRKQTPAQRIRLGGEQGESHVIKKRNLLEQTALGKFWTGYEEE